MKTSGDSWSELDICKQGGHIHSVSNIFGKKSGGSTDLCKGKLQLKDGSIVDVAVKRIRSSLDYNEAFAKVFLLASCRVHSSLCLPRFLREKCMTGRNSITIILSSSKDISRRTAIRQ